MTADIRTAAEAAPVFRFTNAQWREYQQIPDQGYSHRHWIEHQVNEWAARVTPTRDQIAKTIFMTDYEHMGPEAWEAARLDGNNDRQDAFMKADAVLALLQAQAGRDGT